MKQSGRVSIVGLLALVCALGVVVLLVFSKEGLETIGARFMSALAKGDVDQLTKMSYLGKKTPEQIHKDWEFTTTVPGKYYRFAWKVTSAMQSSDTTGAVRLSVQRNLGPGAYDENFQLPMIKINDQWKVDVGGISREMYPGLPRATGD